jgi:glycerol-3-phosphate dehydrogenase
LRLTEVRLPNHPGSMNTFDLLVIGGGINGTAIAAAAAARGLSVLLVEKDDLGSGTSAASSKLIHGGLRYLQYGEVGLVRESLRDRERLLRERPHLVRPLELLIPVRDGDPIPPWKLEAGLFLYDRLAGASQLPRHRRLTRAAALEREPQLEPAGLQGGFIYPDAQIVYPERLCVELAREAADASAVIRTHVEVVGFRRDGARVVGAVLRGADARRHQQNRESTVGDSAGGSTPPPASDDGETVAARLVVNAAGPWVDAVRSLLPEPRAPLLGGTKGSHLVLQRPIAGPCGALYAEARSDGRPFFILPWREMLLIGTTDMRYEGDPGAVAVEPSEIAYLLAETQALFPGAHLGEDEILYTYTGVRPLPASRTQRRTSAGVARITRRHLVVDHSRDGAPGLWSIVGGKLTTHRTLAKQTVGRAVLWLARQQAAGAGEPRQPPSEGSSWDLAALRETVGAAAEGLGLDRAQIAHMVGLYGPRAPAVLARVRADRRLGVRICPRNPDVAAQVEEAVEREWAATLGDLLLRRTGIGTSPCLGLDCVEQAARLMGRAAGWDEARQVREVGDYRRFIERCRRAGLANQPAGEQSPSRLP